MPAAHQQPFNPDLRGTPEQWWREALSAAPDLAPPPARMLVVSPHPDDEVLGAGGLMRVHALAGHPVTVLSITDGEAAHRDWAGLNRIRRRELHQALDVLAGDTIDVVHLGVPDGRVHEHVDAVVDVVRDLAAPGTLLVAPYELDGHPDHDAAGRACRDIARTRGVTLLRYPIWSWHHSTPADFVEGHWARFSLDAATRRAKAQAIECFSSQMQPIRRSPVVPKHVLPYFERPYEAFLR
jgi:LmbE family N-acetylglucosaminyl deacetylase